MPDPPSFVYRDQLSALSHGIALWNPNPPKKIYNNVSIGDVGYLQDGTFIRMFNVMLPWDDPSNRTLANPESYESLDCGPFADTLGGDFDRVKHYSRYVTAEAERNANVQVMTPDGAEGVTYKFRNRGALLSLPNGGRREDVIRTTVFEDYIRDRILDWFTWAQNNKLGVERMEELILVSGRTLVTSWAAAVFVDNNMEAEITLASKAFRDGGARFVWTKIRGSVVYHNSRYDPQNPPTTGDQCVFIRGFRAMRVLFRTGPIRVVGAEHRVGVERRVAVERRVGVGVRRKSVQENRGPNVPNYLDSLTGVLDYIAEESVDHANAEGGLAIAHDDDLQLVESENLDIGPTSVQGTQPNAEAGLSSIWIEDISEQPCEDLSFFTQERQDTDRDSMYSNGTGKWSRDNLDPRQWAPGLKGRFLSSSASTFFRNYSCDEISIKSVTTTSKGSVSSHIPIDTPSNVYWDQFSALSHGIALWNPDPPKKIHGNVSIGDVGYLQDGTFIRMFNVMLPWDHLSNRTFGDPKPYESLDNDPSNTLEEHFDRVEHYSRNISAETNANDIYASSPEQCEGVTYKCRGRGALLFLPNGGCREDAIRTKAFEDYIQEHIVSWFTWAQNHKLGVERMEDLILVSGRTLVTSWAAAVFVDNNSEAEISLASRTHSNGGTYFVWGKTRGSVVFHNSRLDPQNPLGLPDQCVFIRGFREKRFRGGVPFWSRLIRTATKPSLGEVGLPVYDRSLHMNRDARATQWLVGNVYGSNEMQTFVLSTPSSFNQERGQQDREDPSTSIVNPRMHPRPGPLSSRKRTRETTVDDLCRYVWHLFSTYSNEGDSMDTEERRRHLRGGVETAASLVCCTEVELDSFGEVGEVLSALGDKERTNDPSTIVSNPLFTVRWTCLSLVAIRKMLDSDGVQEPAKLALDGIAGFQTGFGDVMTLTAAQRIDGYLKKAWARVVDLHLAFEPWSQVRSTSEIRGILRSREASITELEGIAIETVGMEEVDLGISFLQDAMDDATHKLTRRLPGIFFDELKPGAPMKINEAFDVSPTVNIPAPPQLIFPGQRIQSLCTLGRRWRDIRWRDISEEHVSQETVESTIKSLESLNEISITLRRLDHPIKRQLWRLMDLGYGCGLGFTIELFFLALGQLLSAPLPDELKRDFSSGTFKAITSNWKKSKDSPGTQRILLDLLCDLVIKSRGVFSHFSYPPYIVDMLLDLVKEMMKGHGGKHPHINDIIEELEDDDLRNRIDSRLRDKALTAIGKVPHIYDVIQELDDDNLRNRMDNSLRDRMLRAIGPSSDTHSGNSNLAPVLSQPSMEKSPVLSSQSLSRSQSLHRTASTASKPEHRNGMSSQYPDTLSRTKSAPQPPQLSKSSALPDPRARAETLIPPKRSSRRDSRPPMPERSKSGTHTRSMSNPGGRSLKPAVKQVLTDQPEFRILVLGRRGSGKSALISAAFRVNMSAAPAKASSNINFGFRPDDNHRLIVHEYSGLEPGDAQGLRPIMDFIANRTDPSRPGLERLHAIWICIPASDAINRSIGEGVEDILSMRRVPVIVAFTKSDVYFPQISGSESGNFQYQDHARSRAYIQCEQLCRALFHREPRDVPAELVSVSPHFGALLNNLVVATDRIIMGLRNVSNPSAGSSSQGTNSRTAPTPLAWSVALRVSRDITIQAAVEIGRIRYWRNLWSSLDFADQSLKRCVNVIHNDVVEIWNLYDRNRYLSSSQFKISMSNLVEDLAVQAGDAPPSSNGIGSGDKYADWVDDIYRGSQENVRCVMGYVVNLTVIMDQIFMTAASNVTESAAMKVMATHVRSGRRDYIHRDIRSFVTFAVRTPVRPTPQNDLVLQKMINLIRQYCSE